MSYPKVSREIINLQNEEIKSCPPWKLSMLGLEPNATFEEMVTQHQWAVSTDGCQVVFKRLVELSTDHLENILVTQPVLNITKRIIIAILRTRYAFIPEASLN